MDDGARTLLGILDSGPTGGASKTVDDSYHGPGRGAGNSINTLLDAYTLTKERRFLAKAEEILQRCIHPATDIAALRLDDPEYRWSYLVFLQAVAKYLSKKQELGEADYAFHYARESLLHFADWIARNEVPYKDVLHKVLLPTETWPAHDIRKCHVLFAAADYVAAAQRDQYRERAEFFFERCLTDLLSFPTAHLTRPLVLLSVYGSVRDYFRKRAVPAEALTSPSHDFGKPIPFVPQRARARQVFSGRARYSAAELKRLLGDRVHALVARLGGRQ
jgi:hypothetical protein